MGNVGAVMSQSKPESGHDLTMIDGSLDFSGGVDSNLVTTARSSRNPNGLMRTQLSWADNCTVRGGGITQRTGWLLNGICPSSMTGLYQGHYEYEPDDGGNPYFIAVIGGVVWRVDPDNPAGAVNLSDAYAVPGDNMRMPSTLERVYFCQGEMILVIQAGDGTTLPLFWFGNLLRRSVGIISPLNIPGTYPPALPYNELPSASAMDYYMGRLWYAQGRKYSAGDIVDGPSGSLPYQFRDSIIKVTENPLAIGGDGFIVPSNAGTIRAIKHTANINTQLGQGSLYIYTRKSIYSLSVPVTRLDWIAATNANQPLQTVALITNGSVNDRCIVLVNSDMFYQSLEPAIRSFTAAVRNFQQWGNVPLSINEIRLLQFNDRSLMRFGSGIYFDNRLLQTAAPFTTPVGVAHKALVPLNFDIISTFEQNLPPAWEGMYEGLDILEVSQGDFGGRPRAFAWSWSTTTSRYEVWEITDSSRFDYAPAAPTNHRVQWYVETCAFTWGKEFDLKELVSAELWFDKIFGDVEVKVEYRPDGDPCWYQWHQWKFCTAKTTCEDVHSPACYPATPLRESYRQTVTLPKPKNVCESVSGRPSNIAYQIQLRITVIGWMRIRGIMLHALPYQRKLYSSMVC